MEISPLIWVGAIAMGTLSAYLAHQRGKRPLLWFVLGFLFGIFGLFALFFTSKKKSIPSPTPAPLPSIPGPIDKHWYYLDTTHQQQGPMSHSALTAALHQGKLTPATLVWHEDLPTWQPLQQILG